MPGVEQVFCFENRGREIGVTLTHPHGQIYAYPYVTPRTAQLLGRRRAHRAATGGNLLADVLAAERRAGDPGRRCGRALDRLRARRGALAGRGAPRPAPRRARPAGARRRRARRAGARLPGAAAPRSTGSSRRRARCPTSPAWHQAPVGDDRDLAGCTCSCSRCCAPRASSSTWPGSESAMGAWINDTTPERIAARLREVAS